MSEPYAEDWDDYEEADDAFSIDAMRRMYDRCQSQSEVLVTEKEASRLDEILSSDSDFEMEMLMEEEFGEDWSRLFDGNVIFIAVPIPDSVDEQGRLVWRV